MVRRRLTNAQKLALIGEARQRITNGDSIRSISRDFGIQPQQLRTWLRRENLLLACKRTNKGTYSRRGGCLQEIEEALMEWFFHVRETGRAVNMRTMILKAGTMDPAFAQKPWASKYQAMQRLLKANCITIRIGTRVSQRNPQEMMDEALAFIRFMRPRLSAPDVHQDYIINMDQTPVFFSMHPRATLNLMGESTVHISSTDTATSRVSVSVGITASGNILKPMLTFKGTPTGRIALREFPTYPNRDDCLLTCQEKAWVDEANMMKWINGILRPYLSEKPDGVTPIVMLDSYKVHKMDSIVRAIENLGAVVYHIPGGCTCLAQPVDIGFGRPFKSRIRELWNEYVEEEGIDDYILRTPDRATVARWITDAHHTITAEIVRNAWRKTGLSYFENE